MRAELDQGGLDGLYEGYAWVRIELEPEDNANLAESDSVAIGRYEGSTLEFLQPGGEDNWGGAPARLKLVEAPRINGDMADFLLQPAYVDNMDDMPYEVYLMGKDGKPKAIARSVYFDNVVHSPLRGTNKVQSYEPEEPEKSAELEKPVEPQGTDKTATAGAGGAAMMDQPESGGQSEIQAPDDSQSQTVAQEDAAPDQGEIMPPAYPSYDAPRKKGAAVWVITAIVILLLAAGVGGGWYYFTKMKPAAEANEAAARQAEAEREAAEARAAAEREAREQAAQRAAARAAEAEKNDTAGRVNKFFAGQRDPVTAMQLAAEVPAETSDQKDAVFRLYYYAAEQGDPVAMRRYAEILDPSMPSWGTIQKDGAEAWEYYGKLPDGQEARAKLKEWTEAQARTGNSAARAWLESME